MVEQPQLARAGSSVPVSTHQGESTVLPINVDKAWSFFKSLKLEQVIPQKVKSTTFVSGAANQLGSVVRIDYVDGAVWELLINEISDVRHTLCYQVLSTEPAHQVTSIQGQIMLRPVTDENMTFVQWDTYFSNDADATVIYDQKFKKLEFFYDMKKNLSSVSSGKP